MIELIILVIMGALLLLSIVLFVRNAAVDAYRYQLIYRIYLASKADIEAGHCWRWRYHCLEAVTYSQMIWQFWRRLDSFYPDRRFLEQ